MTTESDTFETTRQPTRYASEDAMEWTYQKVLAGSAVWLIPTNHPAPAEQIHVHYPGQHSDGYGGRTLLFRLEDGSDYEAQGPWHSNADSLYACTGVDLRDQYRTYGCVAHLREYIPNILEDRFVGILHKDQDWVVGRFDRLREIARDFADKLKHPVYCYSKSMGGSSSGLEYPRGTKWEDWKKWKPTYVPNR